jgi:hypothetical protein
MHDYFSNEKGLDNLIWIYSPTSTYGNNTQTSSVFRAVDWDYPGDDYVDIIAGTNYKDDMSIADYAVYAGMGKPLGIAEYGPEDLSGNWDTSRIIQRIKNDYPRIAFFVAWHSYEGSSWSLVSNLNVDILEKDAGRKEKRGGRFRAFPVFIGLVKMKQHQYSVRRSSASGAPVWEHNGIVCLGNILKESVRLTFPAGASLPDPYKIFNSRLDSKTVRVIDVYEGDKVNETVLKALIRSGVEHNLARAKPAKSRKK